MSSSFFARVYVDDLADLGADASLIAVWTKMASWAAWKPHKREFGGQTFYLVTGQLVTAEHALGDATGLGRSIVRRCLAALVKLGKITAVRSKAGTLVTIKRLANVAPAEAPAPEPVHVAPAARQPTDQPRDKTAVKIDSKPLPARASATVCIDPGRQGEERELLAYGQEKLGRHFGGGEAFVFTEMLRDAPRLSAAEVRKRIDWISEHPAARADTGSVTRIFYVEKARAQYARWDANLSAHVSTGLRLGKTADEIVRRAVESMPELDPELMKNWTRREIAKQTRAA